MKKLHGVTVALVNPMDRETEQIDHEKLEQLVKGLLKSGIHCIYCNGTDGEMYHLTTDERKKIAETVVKAADGQVGIKYNYPDINQTIDYLNVNNGDFSVLQGDDRAVPAWLALGCSGTVAGSANVFPEPLIASYNAFKDGDIEKATQQGKVAAAIIDALQNDSIAYFKAGLKIRGFDIGTMRKPLLELDNEQMKELKSQIEEICNKNNITLKLENM